MNSVDFNSKLYQFLSSKLDNHQLQDSISDSTEQLESQSKLDSYLILEFKSEKYAIKAKTLVSILAYEHNHKLPFMNCDILSGFINYNNNVVPLVDLQRLLLGESSTSGKLHRIAIILYSGRLTALAAENINYLIKGEIIRHGFETNSDYISSALLFNQEVIGVIDCEKIDQAINVGRI